LAITQPPNSPADFPAYEGWKSFVTRNNLNVLFESGIAFAFSDLVRTSKFFITTSITEGFGFCFLEPWLAGKILWGRKLPEICRDFENNGLRFPQLYTKLSIPFGWLDRKRFQNTWTTCVGRNCRRYGLQIPPDEIARALDKITANDRIDFGFLNETFQKVVIERVITDTRARRDLLRLNPSLSDIGLGVDPDPLIKENQRAVHAHYHPDLYKKRLLDVYALVMHRKVKQHIDKSILLRRFLNLEKFSLLKWCEDA
jgi:hypothetical protein